MYELGLIEMVSWSICTCASVAYILNAQTIRKRPVLRDLEKLRDVDGIVLGYIYVDSLP